MEDIKIKELVKLLAGLKPAEWSRIQIAVDKTFDSLYVKLRLNDLDSLYRLLQLEIEGKITHEQFES